MQKIRQSSDVDSLPEGEVRQLVRQSFQELLGFGTPYNPDDHGWFLVIEDVAEFADAEPFHGRFSLAEVMRECLFEHVVPHQHNVEIVVALGNSEAVSVYVPLAMFDALMAEAPDAKPT